jgi:hypothetical protein
VRPICTTIPINYPIVAGDLAFANRFGIDRRSAAPSMRLWYRPVTLLIDRRKGRIAEFHSGKVEKAAFERYPSIAVREGVTPMGLGK